jgi:hypothetical protein
MRMRTCARADGRRGEAADPRERERALVVDADAVGVGASGEQLAEADGVGLEQPRQLRAAGLVRVPHRAPVRHVRQAVRHVEHRVQALVADPGRRPRGRGRALRRRHRERQRHGHRRHKHRRPRQHRHGDGEKDQLAASRGGGGAACCCLSLVRHWWLAGARREVTPIPVRVLIYGATGVTRMCVCPVCGRDFQLIGNVARLRARSLLDSTARPVGSTPRPRPVRADLHQTSNQYRANQPPLARRLAAQDQDGLPPRGNECGYECGCAVGCCSLVVVGRGAGAAHRCGRQAGASRRRCGGAMCVRAGAARARPP